MESESSMEYFKLNPKLKPANVIQSNNMIRGLFRGLLMGMIFASLIAYIGFIDLNSVDSDEDVIKLNNETALDANENMAEFLHRKVRVLCFVLPITKELLEEAGQMYLATWAKRCHKFIFFADDNVDKFKEHVVKIEDRRNGWTKLREALAYIYKHHMDDFDWILRTNDNSYVVMENLRWLLYQYEANYPVFIGQRYLKEDYMKGAYTLSKQAFVRLIEVAFTNSEICDENGYDEDKEIAKCLQHVNVIQVDGIDDSGRGMFFHKRPDGLLFPEKTEVEFDKWYWHKMRQGPLCCSDRLMIIQNVRKTHLYYMEYFIYKVHAFGRHRIYEALPQKKTAEEIIKELNK